MDHTHANPPAPIDLIGLIARFLKVFRKLWLIPLALAVLLGCMDYFSSQIRFTPVYRCECLFSVGSSYSSEDIFSGNTFYSDSDSAQTMAKTFPTLLSMDYMNDLILAQLDKPYINGSITADFLEGTNLVQLSVTSSNAQDSYDILNAVLTVYPRAAVYLVDNPTILIRQEPQVPTVPINREAPARSWTDGAVKGLGLGLGLVFLLSLLNQTIGSSEELKKIVNLPILGKIPLLPQRKRRKGESPLLSIDNNPNLAESIRGLRTKVRKLTEEAGGNVVLLTSTIPGEGKTTVSCNLALSLAEAGHKVILVDADLRKQNILKLFQPKAIGGKGLLYALHTPNAPLSDVIWKTSETGLHYISGGSIQRQHYSLDPKSMDRIISQLSQVYDYVIIDSPPCSVVSDTRVLCRYAHCVLYVVKTDGANRMLISDSIASLHNQGISISGCVINGVPKHHSRTGYGYGYGYGYSKKYGKQG